MRKKSEIRTNVTEEKWEEKRNRRKTGRDQDSLKVKLTVRERETHRRKEYIMKRRERRMQSQVASNQQSYSVCIEEPTKKDPLQVYQSSQYIDHRRRQ